MQQLSKILKSRDEWKAKANTEMYRDVGDEKGT